MLESPSRMEPALPEPVSGELLDLVAELSSAAGAVDARLHPTSAAGLADAVRMMNCYFSNLIEGHNTTPHEIEAAVANYIPNHGDRRNLMIEARAHIRLQREIDRQHAAGALPDPASPSFIRWLHREFYNGATADMLDVEGRFTMVPGEFRALPGEDVAVGRHQPPSASAVAAFMAHFETRYRLARLGAGSRLLAMAAAHHRLNYIHPFLDGNGRVSRLMSHAMGLQAGVGAHGLWSVSRGLARGLRSRREYKLMMDRADTPRQGDLDGRGNLSLRALQEFCAWFLTVCLDQVRFMSRLFALDALMPRLRIYAERRQWRPEAALLLQRAMQQGEVPRGDATAITGLRERSARTLLGTMTGDGILGSVTPKGPVSLRFRIDAIEILFPGLFPET